MRNTILMLLAGALALCGCSRTYESGLLGLEYEPPRGFELLNEQQGPPALARFSKGLELRSAEAKLPEISEAHLDAILRQAWKASGTEGEPGEVVSARVGTVRNLPVARYALREGGSRTLVYVVPHDARFVLVRLTTSESAYAQLESLVERSLGSLKLRD